MKAYVINLPRCKERRRHMVSQLALSGLGWELVEGVDARQVGDCLLEPSYVTAEFRASASGAPTAERGVLRPGAVACALSHKKALQRLAASGEPFGLVLEDDVELPVDIELLTRRVGAQLSPWKAEMVLLNFHKPGGLELCQSDALLLGSGRWLALPADLRNLTSGAAYMLTAEAARRLADWALPMRGFSDEWGLFVGAGVLERVRVVAPMPVRQSPAFRTTIDFYSRGSIQWWLRELASRSKVDHLPGLRRLIVHRRLRDMQRWGALGDLKVPLVGPDAAGRYERVPGKSAKLC